jgi:hypothetical protein
MFRSDRVQVGSRETASIYYRPSCRRTTRPLLPRKQMCREAIRNPTEYTNGLRGTAISKASVGLVISPLTLQSWVANRCLGSWLRVRLACLVDETEPKQLREQSTTTIAQHSSFLFNHSQRLRGLHPTARTYRQYT